LRRTASYEVPIVKIRLTVSPVGERKNQKSELAKHSMVEGAYFAYMRKKPWTDWAQILFGGRRLRRNHDIQIWWRSVKGFRVGWGSKFALAHSLRRSSLQHSRRDLSSHYSIHRRSHAWWSKWQCKIICASHDYAPRIITFFSL